MKRKIYFHGEMKQKYGEYIELNVSSVSEAARALCVLLKDFQKYLSNKEFSIVRGDPEDGFHIGEEELTFHLGNADLHITPVTSGSGGGNGGAMKVVLGVALIGAAVMFAPGFVMAGTGHVAGINMGATAFAGLTFGNIAALGAAIALTGVASMLSPTPSTAETREQEERRESFIFRGPQNVAEQGRPIPLCYGIVRTGSLVVSAGLSTEEYQPGEDTGVVSSNWFQSATFRDNVLTYTGETQS